MLGVLELRFQNRDSPMIGASYSAVLLEKRNLSLKARDVLVTTGEYNTILHHHLGK